MRVLSTYLTLHSNNFKTSDTRYSIFPLIRINGILPVSRQPCNVQVLMCNIRQTSLFVRYFYPSKCGIRFFSACLMVSCISSKAVKNEAIQGSYSSEEWMKLWKSSTSSGSIILMRSKSPSSSFAAARTTGFMWIG